MAYFQRGSRQWRFCELVWGGIPETEAAVALGAQPDTGHKWMSRLLEQVEKDLGRPTTKAFALRALFDGDLLVEAARNSCQPADTSLPASLAES